jgi:hypothetical protein
VHRPPEHLPNPWLFDTGKLLRELDRCRELVLLIPAPTHEAHFAANIAIDAIWNLREHIRYLLSLHRQGQSSWAQIHQDLQHSLHQNPIAGAKGMEQKRQLREVENQIRNLQEDLAKMKNQFAKDHTHVVTNDRHDSTKRRRPPSQQRAQSNARQVA